LTSELERIKILEGKISQVVEYINKINSDEARRAGKLDENLKSFEKEREAIKTKIESIIGQIDQLEI
jgi:DNA-directed RNA polymerase subunit F